MEGKLNQILKRISEKAEADRDDDFCGERLAELLPQMLATIPELYAQRYLDVIQASVEAVPYNIGTLILAEQIPKQLGFVPYDKHDLGEPKILQESQRDFYLDVALKVVREQPMHDTDILKNLPDIIFQQGSQKARKIMKIALQIKDEDFGDYNVVLLYTGEKAGHQFCGDQEEQALLISQVEHKFLGTPLVKKRVFTRDTIDDFCIRVQHDPKKRRGFIDSVYAEIHHGMLEELDAHSIEAFASICNQYGFSHYAEKLLDSTHYKNVRDYDDAVVKHELVNGPVSAVYQTRNTRMLDALFGLNGTPADEAKVGDLMGPCLWIGNYDSETVMPRFARLAGKTGHFLGIPLDEAVHFLGTSESNFDGAIHEGYLEVFKHEGVAVIAPTAKYQPFVIRMRRHLNSRTE